MCMKSKFFTFKVMFYLLWLTTGPLSIAFLSSRSIEVWNQLNIEAIHIVRAEVAWLPVLIALATYIATSCVMFTMLFENNKYS